MLNFGFLTYYFCFILSNPYEPRDGFNHGSKFAIALRYLIIIFTSYFIVLEVVSITDIVRSIYKARKEGENNKHVVQHLITRLFKNLLLFLNIFIVVEHSTHAFDIGITRLA